MSRTAYDDWNIAGSNAERNLPGTVPYNSKTNSFIFIVSTCLLLIIGLICNYSASYPLAIENGLSSTSYFIRQLIYACIGLLGAVVLLSIPEKAVKLLCPMFMIICLLVLGSNFFIKSEVLISNNMMGVVFFAQIMYLGLFFANRADGITRLRELILPISFSILFFVAILLQKNFAYGLLFLLITIVMFACGGVGAGGVILFVLYALVPTICWILSNEANLRTILNLLVPGYYNSSSASQFIYARSAIANGGLFGKGLGMGEFKTGLINDISGGFIFCNVCEEFGLVGSLFIVILFFCFAWSGYRCSKHIREYNRFYSNYVVGITTLIVWQFILNILSVFGIIPLDGFLLPFFSSGTQIILIIIECALVYKAMLEKPDLYDYDSPFDSLETERFYDLENS